MRRETLGLLKDIRDAARFIDEDTAGATFDSFMQDRPMRQLVAHNFELIGEAVNRLRHREPDVVERISAYQKIIALRNTLIHRYDEIDYPTLWQIVQESLPVLATEVEQLLREAEAQ